MAKIESDWTYINGISNGESGRTLPIQVLPSRNKGEKWQKANMDALESIGIRQLHSNARFRSYRQMVDGQFTGYAVGIDESEEPWFLKEVRGLRASQGIPTYLKHFDFMGMVINALTGVYSDFEDRFVVDSRDEYSTNEFIRQKTEMLHQYAASVFQQEVNKLLLMRGIDPNKQDFETEEEAQAYQQEIQQQVQSLTPPEIERFMSKNFKVLAAEWAQNTIEQDKIDFRIPSMDRENFVDFLLSGRYFKHFRVGYDNYEIERWLVEEVFFSQDVDARFPQDGEFVGRITNMSPSNILNKFGHLMTTKQLEGMGNYWNQTKNYDSFNGAYVETSNKPVEEKAFGTPTIVPFHNYFDHNAITQLEDASGIPLSKTTVQGKDGENITFDTWTPRLNDYEDFRSDLYTSFLRDDIDVRRDTVRVTEAYWRSYKRLGVLIMENDLGSVTVELTTDDLLSDFIKEREIKSLRNISLQELQNALKEERLSDYINTITYIYVPEVWKGIKIRGNGSTIKNDIYLDVKPLEYQIKGSTSNLYDVKLPVAGIIDTGIAIKLAPFQQLHNICMNQITELLEKELGVFFMFDITGLSSEYQDETTEESIFKIREIIKDTGLVGFDLSRQNTQGNQPNLFSRQEVVYATQVEYRYAMAQRYKQEALSMIGVTPQMLGAPQNYTTAEGVKQGAQASYSLINPLFDKMNDAKAKELELHIAIAQYCQTHAKDNRVLFRKSDGEQRFLDILAEDGELFPLRSLGVTAVTSSKDRKIAETIRTYVMNDNTVAKDLSTAIELLTNGTIVEMKEIADNAVKKTQQQVQEDRQFQQSQLDKQIQAQAEEKAKEREHDINIELIKSDTDIRQSQIAAFGRIQDNAQGVDYNLIDRIEKSSQNEINNNFRAQEIAVKQGEVDRKVLNDSENRLIELEKLKNKSEELKVRREAIQAEKQNSIINKN